MGERVAKSEVQMTEKVFVYNDLQFPVGQLKVFGYYPKYKHDTLENYYFVLENVVDDKETRELMPIKIPNVRPQTGRSVDGVVLELSPNEMNIVTDYEPKHYQRAKVRLKSDVVAWLYWGV